MLQMQTPRKSDSVVLGWGPGSPRVPIADRQLATLGEYSVKSECAAKWGGDREWTPSFQGSWLGHTGISPSTTHSLQQVQSLQEKISCFQQVVW